MRKFLSIIIPRYTESEKEVFPLLSSIYGQVGVDFSDMEIIIVNDGGGNGPLDDSFLSLFSFPIRQVHLEQNGGPGVTRQAGLDVACGEYVMFCDADDTLHNVGVLGAFMQKAETAAPDLITSSWLEELRDENGNYQYIPHDIENTWMHGKLFRRKFLQHHGIRFHDTLRVHEDSYFLCLVSAFAQRVERIPATTYVWKFRPDSITRRNGAVYTFDSIPTFIEACSLAHKEVERINPALMEYKILQFTLYNYFCFHQPKWLAKENEKYLKDGEAAFVKYMQPFWRYWENAPSDKIAEIYNQERTRSFVGCVEKETVHEWIKRLGLPEKGGM